MAFLNDLVFKGDRVVVKLRYQGRYDVISVPVGFRPRVMHPVYVLREWLYWKQPEVLKAGGYVPITRAEADGITRRALRESGSWTRWPRWLVWRAVHWIQWRAYRKLGRMT